MLEDGGRDSLPLPPPPRPSSMCNKCKCKTRLRNEHHHPPPAYLWRRLSRHKHMQKNTYTLTQGQPIGRLVCWKLVQSFVVAVWTSLLATITITVGTKTLSVIGARTYRWEKVSHWLVSLMLETQRAASERHSHDDSSKRWWWMRAEPGEPPLQPPLSYRVTCCVVYFVCAEARRRARVWWALTPADSRWANNTSIECSYWMQVWHIIIT